MKIKFLNIFLMLIAGVMFFAPAISNAVLDVPENLIPSNGSVGVDLPVLLEWDSVLDGEGDDECCYYKWELETIKGGKIANNRWPYEGCDNEKDNFSPPSLKQGNEYQWKIKACNSWDDCSGSSWQKFGVGTLDKPNLLSPSGDGISLTPVLKWEAVDNAVKYKLIIMELSEGSTDPDSEDDFENIVVSEEVSNKLSIIVPDSSSLELDTDYKACVIAYTQNKLVKSEISNVLSFTTANLLEQPSLTSPSNGATEVSYSPKLDWDSVPGADEYNWKITKANGEAVFDGDTTNTYFNAFTLSEAGTYKWSVQAKSGTTKSPWAFDFTFTTRDAVYTECASGRTNPHYKCIDGICTECPNCGVTQCSSDTDCISPPSDDPSVTPPVGGECDNDADCEGDEECFCADSVKGIKGLCAPKGSVVICPPTTHASFTDLVNSIINFIYTIALVIAPVMFIVAGFTYITSIGEPAKIKKAYDIALWTAIGLLIVLLSKGIIVVIKEVLG